MSYILKIGSTGVASVDLFPDQELNISLSYYDLQDPASIKIPFSFSEKIPYTANNKVRLGYNHEINGYSGLTGQPLKYELYNDGDVISKGSVKVTSVVLNSQEPYFELEMIDSVSDFVNNLKEYKFSDIYEDTFSTTLRTLSTYLNGNQQYDNRDIEIPFIDVDNVQEKDGYPSRQLTSYGVNGKKFGLFPAINVKNFFERCFTKAGFSYSSEFLSGTASFNPTNMYVMIPSYLSSDEANQRNTRLFPYPYNIEINEDLSSDQAYYYANITNYSNGGEYGTFGPTNYDVSDNNVEYEYGNMFRTPGGVLTNDPRNIGYVGFGSAFSAVFNWHDSSAFQTISGLKVTIPGSIYKHTVNSVDLETPVVPHFTSVNTAKFTPYIYIYEAFQSGDLPKYSIPLTDSGGARLELTPSGIATSSATLDQAPTIFGTNYDNTLTFADFNAYIDQDEFYELLGGTRYHIAFGMRMVSGNITADLYTTEVGENPVAIAEDYSFTSDDIRKQRTWGYDWADVGVSVKNAGNIAATCPSDKFTFQESLMNNESIKVYDLFVDLIKRFGLSMVYDYTQSTPTIIVDNLSDIRDAVVLSVDSYVDTLKEFQITSPTASYKKIILNNKKNKGKFDIYPNEIVVGSHEEELNPAGSGDFKIDFITSLINPINKSICGDFAVNDTILSEEGVIGTEEIGLLSNEIIDYNELGLRLFYLQDVDYKTTVRYPAFRRYNNYNIRIDQNLFRVMGSYNLGGYPVNAYSGVEDLRFADRNGNTFNTFDLFVASERVSSVNNTRITFYAAFPESFFINGWFFKKKFKFNSTNENFVIGQLTDARIYDGYIYGKVEAIFVD